MQGGYLVPGTLGMGLVEGYDAINLPLAYPELRAELERDLKLICLGERDPNVVLEEQIKKYREAYKVITENITDMDTKLAERFEVAPVDLPDAQAQRHQTIEEVFKCPRCNRFNMAVRSKKDNAGYYITCMGKPTCNHIIWLNDLIKEIKVQDTDCPKCRGGVKSVKIKFKRMNILSLLSTANVTDDNYYVSCFRCDSTLKTVLDIEESNLRPSNAANISSNIFNGTSGAVSRNTAAATTNGNIAPNNNNNNQRQWAVPAAPAPPRPPAARPNANNFNNNRINTNAGGNAVNRSLGNDQDVFCPRCQQPAKKYVLIRVSIAFHFISNSLFCRLTVKKEGPNTGRPFYVCPKQPQCDGNFFQWADVPAGNNTSFAPSSSAPTTYSSHNSRASTSRGAPSSSAGNNNNDGSTRAKRKCGICKEEGHTRQKCPRGPNAQL